jgi:pyruvate,water dikinase
MIIGILRERVLEIGDELVEAGRLDHAEQVFNLRMDELDRALVDPSLELRALIADNIWFYKKLHSLKNLPRVVDSRGKILQARKKEKADADFIGDPISPGTVTGSIKVLKSPDEKPILPGEILVARATDPGWTPLFVNAAGVILEVGGMLQHGALVAREYGKPCICGVETATSALQDGQIVEMNGTDGTIKLVPAEI